MYCTVVNLFIIFPVIEVCHLVVLQSTVPYKPKIKEDQGPGVARTDKDQIYRGCQESELWACSKNSNQVGINDQDLYFILISVVHYMEHQIQQ